MRFILMRHAEASSNLNPAILTGVSFDAPLTETGIKHAQRVALQLAHISPAPAGVYVSPTRRTMQTAKLLLPADTPFETADSLIEVSRGTAENKLRDEAFTPEILIAVKQQQKDFRFPKGESMNDAASRLSAFIGSISKEHKKDDTILVVSHAMLIRGYISELLDWTYDETIANELDHCACTVIELTDSLQTPKVIGFNVSIESLI